MFKTLTDTSKAAIFSVLVLILAVAAALAIKALGLTSLLWAVVWSSTPSLATVIMFLVVTRDGRSRQGWRCGGDYGDQQGPKIAIHGLSAGVLSLLRGETPPDVPMPHHPLLASATLIIATVTVLMLSGMAWTIVTLRRWRAHPNRRPRRPWALGRRLALSSAIHLGWGLGLLIIFPALAYPLPPTLLIMPDLGYLILISSEVALGWGIARPPLTYFTLRQRDG